MDLGGWNAEFDPNLLGEWAEGVDTSQRTSSDKDDNGEDDPLTSALPVFTDDDPAISEQSLGDTGECEQKQDESSSLRPVPQHATYNSASAMSLAEHAAAISETASVLSARDERSAATGSSGGSSSRNNNSVNHPLAISSSASCPPPGSATMGHAPGPPILHPPSTSSDLYSVDLSQALERSNLGVFGPMNAAVAVPVEGPPIATHNNNNHPHLSTLTNNFLLATSASLQPQPQTMQQTTASAPHTHHHNHHHSHHRQQHTASTNGGATKSSPKPAGGSQQPRHSQHGSTTSTRPAASSSTTSSSLPPFYLFGAPIELRANFMANQRKRGLPIECNDPNSFYYGETVNGYHPQQLLKSCMTNQQTAASLLQVGFDPTKHRHTHDPLPKMIDARHGNSRRSSKGGQQKNEREQKRAQKITELIEQLRGQIEESGWQVDGRSKFNILSK